MSGSTSASRPGTRVCSPVLQVPSAADTIACVPHSASPTTRTTGTHRRRARCSNGQIRCCSPGCPAHREPPHRSPSRARIETSRRAWIGSPSARRPGETIPPPERHRAEHGPARSRWWSARSTRPTSSSGNAVHPPGGASPPRTPHRNTAPWPGRSTRRHAPAITGTVSRGVLIPRSPRPPDHAGTTESARQSKSDLSTALHWPMSGTLD